MITDFFLFRLLLFFFFDFVWILILVEWYSAAAFFTTYELLKGLLPDLFPALRREEMAPIVHMLSASGGEVVSLPSLPFSLSSTPALSM